MKLPSVLQLPFFVPLLKEKKKILLQAGEVLVTSVPITDICSNIPQHLAVTSPPTIKSSLVSNTGADLCALAHSRPSAFILPQPLCDRQDWSPLQQPSTLPAKGQQWKNAPRGPLRMDSWIKHVPEASFLSPRSAQALIHHGSRELPTVTSPSFPEQKGTVLRSQSFVRGPPSNTVTSH